MYDELIRNLRRYVPLADVDIRAIHSLFTSRKFRRRQFILQEGDIIRFESFMVRGLTRTYEIDRKGREHIIQFGLEDWWIGDLYSFLTETPSRYAIDCLEDTEILQISRVNLEQLYATVPSMERCFRIMIQNAFIAATHRLAANLAKTAGERYEAFLNQYPQIGSRVPDRQIAAYLGITPQSLSRIRSRGEGNRR
jgi:CRP-like cAMP-binding protein